MPSEARQKKIMEKLNRAQKCSILGPQNLGSGGGARAPGAPPWIRTCIINRKSVGKYYTNTYSLLPKALKPFRLLLLQRGQQNICNTQFLAELLLCYLTGNIFGLKSSADDMRMMCR